MNKQTSKTQHKKLLNGNQYLCYCNDERTIMELLMFEHVIGYLLANDFMHHCTDFSETFRI